MENKQTAVEWLHIEFQNRFPKETSEMYNNNQLSYEDMIQQAKEMERQQIIDAANLPIKDRGYDATKFSNCGEQHYVKTYEK